MTTILSHESISENEDMIIRESTDGCFYQAQIVGSDGTNTLGEWCHTPTEAVDSVENAPVNNNQADN